MLSLTLPHNKAYLGLILLVKLLIGRHQRPLWLSQLVCHSNMKFDCVTELKNTETLPLDAKLVNSNAVIHLKLTNANIPGSLSA